MTKGQVLCHRRMSVTQAVQASALRTPGPAAVLTNQAFSAAERPWMPHNWLWMSLEQNTTRGYSQSNTDATSGIT